MTTNKKNLASQITLHLTSSEPERYEAYHKKTYIGTLGVQQGVFQVKDTHGDIIYRSTVEGEKSLLDKEREKYLNRARRRLSRVLAQLIKYEDNSQEMFV